VQHGNTTSFPTPPTFVEVMGIAFVFGAVLALSPGTAHAQAGGGNVNTPRVSKRAAAAAAAAASIARDAADDAPAAKPVVKDWMPAHGRECSKNNKGAAKGKWFCQGPRRVPKPVGADAERAERIGLGTQRAAGDLLFHGPTPEWQQAAGPDKSEVLLWPVAEGKMWRGLERARRTPTVFKPRHKGLDIGAPQGTLIRATKSGIVAYADNGLRGYGNLLITIHGDGSVAFYGHCRSIYVFPGQLVKQGQIVAEVGATGVARGAHLHFEYRTKGQIRNPLKYFTDPAETTPVEKKPAKKKLAKRSKAKAKA
jgi:murein DD-endopeptidase MepM/ murein hydrolase activator NlpD